MSLNSYDNLQASYRKLTAREVAGEWADSISESDEESAAGAEMTRRIQVLTDEQETLNKGRVYLAEVAKKMLTKSEIPEGFAELVASMQLLSEFLNDNYGRV